MKTVDMTPERVEAGRAANRRCIQKKAQTIRDYKVALGCADCGVDHVAVLDLHHRDPATKNPKLRRGTKGSGALAHLTYAEIAAELEKCDVVCSNCHRIREYEERMVA